MKHARPKRSKKRSRTRPLLWIFVILLLVVTSVIIANVLKPDSPENPPATTNNGTDVSTSVTNTEGSGFATDSNGSASATDTALLSQTSESVTDTDAPTTDTETATSSSTDKATDTQTSVTTIIPPPADGTTKRVAFTFDDGPHYKYTRQIADAFTENGGKCTFFVVANRITGTNGEAMGYAASLGHEIGSHSFSHTANFKNCANDVYQAELKKAHDAIKNAIGVAPTLMRPPGGNITKDRVASSAYSIIMWNVDPNDWKYHNYSEENVTTIVNNVLSAITDGDIVLMHDIWPNTPEAVRILLPMLKDAGYEFVTVSELLGEHKAAGIRYSCAY